MFSLFKTKKKDDIYGINLKDIVSSAPKNRAAVCLVRAILIFICTIGTLLGLMSAFDITFYHMPFILIVLFVSLYTAFMYYNRITFYIGYLLYFAAFTILIIMFYRYINSGYQAFMNIMFEGYKEYFNLEYSRDAVEIISNRPLTITIALSAVGAFLALLLNVVISGYMNLFETFFLTFPLLQLGIYISKEPDTIYILLLLCSYALIGIFHRTGQYRSSHPGKNKHNTFFRLKRKKNISYIGKPNARSMSSLMALTFIFAAAFLMLFSNIFKMSAASSNSVIKTKTDEVVKNFVQTGLSGLFNRYRATGGLSNGRLGGISSIRPNYRTDITVTFAPYSYETIYLPAYTGTRYTSYGWISDLNAYDFFYGSNVAYTLDASAKMIIKREPDVSGIMTPYVTTSYNINGDTINAYYSPFTSYGNYKKNEYITEEYNDYIYSKYLQVPFEISDTLNDIIIENHLMPKDDILYDDLLYALTAAQNIANYFDNNFLYTMSPGATPSDKDFVEYFLKNQKKGFCAHFASAAVLLLREMGIPARYKEGYVVGFDSIASASALNDETLSDWYEGEMLLDATTVIKAEVTDANAHAWVEVYADYYGFIPIEVTPASDENYDNNNSGFLNILYGLFNAVNLDSEGNTDNTDNNLSNTDILERFNLNFFTKPFIIMSILFITPIIMLLIKKLIFKFKCRIYFSNGKYKSFILIYYQKLIKILNRHNFMLNTPCTGRKLYQVLIKPEAYNHIIKPEILNNSDADKISELSDKLTNIFNAALYSNKGCSKTEADFIKNTFKFK